MESALDCCTDTVIITAAVARVSEEEQDAPPTGSPPTGCGAWCNEMEEESLNL